MPGDVVPPESDEPGVWLHAYEYLHRSPIAPGLEEIDIGPAGKLWLRDSLRSGHGLSHRFLATRHLGITRADARTFTIFPEGATTAHLLDFESATTWVRVPSVFRRLTEVLRPEENWIVIEDDLRRRSDVSEVHQLGPFGRAHGEDLYFVRPPSVSIFDLGRSISAWTNGYPTNVFALAPIVELSNDLDLSAAELDAMAPAVRVIVSAAYDGGGFVVWQQLST